MSYGDYKVETIWDAGGVDTIDLSDTDGYTVLDMRGGSINSVDVHTLDEIIEIHQEDVHSKGVNQSDVDSWIADKITLLYYDI